MSIAMEVGAERPLWELAAVRLRDRIADHPDSFEPKHRWAMDWYYPVLTGAITGDAAVAQLASKHDTFVMDDRGVRCVSDNPWITAAETCECAMAYLNIGDTDTAHALFSWVQNLRDDDGAYFTGIVYPDFVNFPDQERSTYSSAAVILAADALDRITPASGLFLGETLPELNDS